MSSASLTLSCLLSLTLSLANAASASPRSAPPSRAAQGTADEAALRALAEEYFRAWATKDIDAYVRLWAVASPDLAAHKQEMQKFFADYERIEVKTPLVQRITIDGERARLRVDVEVNAVEVKTGKPAADSGLRRRVLEYARENGGWHVWREASAFDELAKALAATAVERERDALLAGEKDLWTPELTLAVNRQGIGLASKGLYPEALNVFRIAQNTAEKINDEGGRAGALGNIGLIHFNQGDYDLALEPIQQSLRLAEAIGEQAVMSRAWNNLGLVYQGQGNLDLALEAYKKCLALAKARQDKNLMPLTLGNIGNLYNAQGNYRLAAESYQQSLAYYRETGAKAGEGRILNSLGNIQYYQGNYELAQELYRESLALKEATGNRVEQSRTINALGRLYTEQGNYKLAEEFHRRSLALSEAAEAKVEIARSYDFLGGMYLLKGDYDAALECFQKSLKLYETSGDKKGAGDTLNGLSQVYLRRGSPALALEAATRAAENARRIGGLEMLWAALTNAGQAQKQLAQTAEARRSFEAAIDAIEAQRVRVAGGEQDARRYFETRLSPYHELVELLVGQRLFGEALAYAEQAKARALLDVLQHGRVGIQKAMTADERAQEGRLKSELVMLNTLMTHATQADKPNAERLGLLKSRLEKARLDYEVFQTSLYAAHPELKVRRGEAPVINAQELAGLLPDATTALLEYVVTVDNVYLFCITRAAGRAEPEVKAYTMPLKRDELARQVEAFRRQLAGRDLGFRATAATLYGLLLEPAAAQLRGKTGVVIAPDDVLWDLPFQALLTRANRFLLESATVAYAPSLTVLREMMKHPKNQSTDADSSTLLAVGNPLVGKETASRATLALRDEKLDPLPEAEEEVKALRQLYGNTRSRVYVGAEASEERVKREAGQARILHFAAHGMLNNAAPMYSHLALAQGGANEDGLLEAWELTGLELKAELAALSACETARGRIGAGEGMVGLSWAMFVAGVPSVVVSQWKVESASTRDLMVNFHRALSSPPTVGKTKPTKAEALRQSALKLLKEPNTSHPFYWAGFVLVGDAR